MRRATLTLILIASLMTFFHNCSDVQLGRPSYETVAASSVAGDVQFCVPTGYQMASFYVRNLNAVMRFGFLTPDSDGDGLDDIREQGIGSSITKRRSQDKVTDAICLETTANFNCTTLPLSCSTSENLFRLNSCDFMMLGLDQVAGLPTLGLDSDRDDIPDIIELAGGSRPGIPDAQDDSDHDLTTNRHEFQFGRNPRQADAYAQPASLTQFNLVKEASPGACAGELWTVTIHQLPLVPVEPYDESVADAAAPVGAVPMSHLKNENVILYIAKLKPSSGAPGARGRIYFTYSKQTYIPGDIAVDLTPPIPFKQAGDVQP